MARQKGPLKYVGTLGDIRHFKIKGNEGYFAGLVGGPTAEQIATDPAFQRTRENMNEFSGCAMAGKSVRVGLASLMKNMADSQVTGRLTAIMKKINLEDGSEARGKRAVLITAVPNYLKGFDFNRFTSFNGAFNAPFTITPSASRDSSTLDVLAFNPLNYLNIPAGATHFRIINGISVISDFEFNTTSKVYEPKEATLNEMKAVEYSGYLPVDQVTSTLSLVATLPGTPTMTTDVMVINVIGIEFYQEVNSNYYVFAQGNAMKISEIF
ncbi:MAG: hypothetical protein R2730_00250 [Chitinophagales bacterium]